ncbi:MAG: serine acetyltransferase [Agathobacter sp.]|nr:serine acetyltransferase [Agathobacter sp.]
MNIQKCDLYRWNGDVTLKYFCRMFSTPKYRIIYFKRKCEASQGKIRFVFYRAIYELMINKYTTDIPSKTKIGPGFIIRHVGGIAINAEAVIGKNVEILQGVTIGSERRGSRTGSPHIGDNVWIGTNAVIVGKISIGNNVLIAPNAYVNFDVPDNSIVIGNPGKIVAKDNATEGYILYTDYELSE